MVSSREPLKAEFQVVETGKELGLKLLAEAPSPQDFPEEFLGMYNGEASLALFSMSREQATRESITIEINRALGKEVDMGDLPSLIAHGEKSIDQIMDPENLYTLFVMCGKRKELGLAPLTSRRFGGKIKKVGLSADGETLLEPAPQLTLQEMKYLAMSDIGLTPEEAKGVKATVAGYAAINNRMGAVSNALGFHYKLPGTDDPTVRMSTLVGFYTPFGILYRVRGLPPGSPIPVTDLRAALGKPLVRRV